MSSGSAGTSLPDFSLSSAKSGCERLSSAPLDFRALLEASLDMICLIEVSGHTPRIVYASTSTLDTVGWTPEEILALAPEKLWTPDALAAIGADIARLRAGQQTSTLAVEAATKDGRHIWLENKVRVLSRSEGGIMSLMACMRDVTRHKMLEEQLAEQALLDGLTGIHNRRAFDQCLDREWRRALRTGLPFSLVLMDVDFFKRFNDTYGHQAGDDCLCAVARAVRGRMKRAGDLVARYGGEEIAALLPATELAGAETLANNLCSIVAELKIPHSGNASAGGVVTISCGVSCVCLKVGGSPPMPARLVLAADTALYRAKSEGRNRVSSSPALNTIEMMSRAR